MRSMREINLMPSRWICDCMGWPMREGNEDCLHCGRVRKELTEITLKSGERYFRGKIFKRHRPYKKRTNEMSDL